MVEILQTRTASVLMYSVLRSPRSSNYVRKYQRHELVMMDFLLGGFSERVWGLALPKNQLTQGLQPLQAVKY
jgi:hypothetical protein